MWFSFSIHLQATNHNFIVLLCEDIQLFFLWNFPKEYSFESKEKTLSWTIDLREISCLLLLKKRVCWIENFHLCIHMMYPYSSQSTKKKHMSFEKKQHQHERIWNIENEKDRRKFISHVCKLFSNCLKQRKLRSSNRIKIEWKIFAVGNDFIFLSSSSFFFFFW